MPAVAEPLPDRAARRGALRAALIAHWPEHLCEALGLGLFLVSAAGFAVLLGHPDSPVQIASPLPRRVAMGLAMGLTAIANVYSPWGRRSGAHLNPAVTLLFARLGKIAWPDVVWFVLAQCAGGLAGLLLARGLFGPPVAHASVNWVATTPAGGVGPAFAVEIAISFGLMLAVLCASNSRRWMGRTGVLAGALVATWITLAAPVSGMSMNPARSLASALPAAAWQGFWIYLVAPPLGMLLAAEAFVRLGRARVVHCAKLQHDATSRCIFACRFGELAAPPPAETGAR